MKLPIPFGTLILIINIILIIFLIFFERRNPTTTWAWILILTVLPIVGFLIYLLFGQDLSYRKMFSKKIIDDEKKNAYINKITKNYIYDSNSLENKDIIKMNFRNAKSLYTQMNDVKLYFDGKDKFNDLFEEIRNAEKFIHMEYYIVQSDNLGHELIELLTQKAKEGVEVKFLFDAMGSNKLGRDRDKILKGLKEAGGSYASFFPSRFSYINKRINYRDHRKIVVIDGKAAFLGGFNVGDEYVGKNKKIGYWRDTHLRIKGNAVNDLEARFLMDWTYASKEDIKDYNSYFPRKENIPGRVGMQIVSSGPDHNEQYIKNGYVKIINNAKKSLYVQSPYFVPDDNILDSLKISAFSGVDVRLMLPKNPDHKFMAWGAQSYITELLKAGVRVFLYDNGFLHCKAIMADDSVCSVGTANMDIRSFKLNFETNAFIYNSEITNKLENQFFIDMQYSKEINIEEFKHRSRLSRTLESITRLVSPIL